MAKPRKEDGIAVDPIPFDASRNPNELWVSNFDELQRFFRENFRDGEYERALVDRVSRAEVLVGNKDYLDMLRRILLQASEFGYSLAHAGHISEAGIRSAQLRRTVDPFHPLYLMHMSCFLGSLNTVAYGWREEAANAVSHFASDELLDAIRRYPNKFYHGNITPTAQETVQRAFDSPELVIKVVRESKVPTYPIDPVFNGHVAEMGREFRVGNFGELVNMHEDDQRALVGRFAEAMPWISVESAFATYPGPLLGGTTLQFGRGIVQN